MKAKNLLYLISTVFLLSWKSAGTTEVKHVDLVFCLDLSASTNGILNDVRNRIWNITNGILQKAELTNLRIGIVGYGRPSFGSSDGYVRIISDLTTDLDFLHYQIHQLKAVIEKGDQFVPNALFETRKHLRWSNDPTAEKIVFLIGNGSAYTGPLNLNDICEEYTKSNIRINTVYVEQEKENLRHKTGYMNIAALTRGKFYTMRATPKVEINKNISDAQMAINMSNSLNSTFMFYSKNATERKKILLETDKNTLKMGVDYFYSRLLYKTSQHHMESYAPFDLTSYFIRHHKMPARINYDYLMQTEKTTDVRAIEDSVRKKAFARIRLNDEIRWMFRQIEKDTITVSSSLLDGFVLGSYQ